MLCRFLTDMGARVVAAVAPTNSPTLSGLPVDDVIVGDLEDMENLARRRNARLLITNSHGAEAAARLDLPHLRAGYPLYDSIGGHAQTWVGYRGSRLTLFAIANLLLAQRREVAPYRSIFWQDTPRATETCGAAAPCIV
jgi:nitrogenase molybdenum-iron protein NifN